MADGTPNPIPPGTPVTDSPATDNNAVNNCPDPDGDGFGFANGQSCRTDGQPIFLADGTPNPIPPNTIVPLSLTGTINPLSACGASTTGFNSARDLLVLHYDFGGDPNDGHAAAANKALVDTFNIDQLWVVGGTNSISQNNYLPGADALMNQIYGDGRWTQANVLDSSGRNAAILASTNRWLQTLNNGGQVWVAEGGPSDFTHSVLQAVKDSVSDCDAATRIHVVQHSDTNELNTGQDLAYIQTITDYVRIDDGNDANSTADLHAENNSQADNIGFINQALGSRWSSEWQTAFEFLPPGTDTIPGKLDFSDTVELLHILNVPVNEVTDWSEFADRFF